MTEITLNVEGMACEGCANAVRRAVAAADPVAAISVDLATGLVVVAKRSVPPERIVGAVEAAGYQVLAAQSVG